MQPDHFTLPPKLGPCAGENCTDPREHSLECQAQHAAAVAGGTFVKMTNKADFDMLMKQMTEVSNHLCEMLRAQGMELVAEAERHRVDHEAPTVSPKRIDGIMDYAVAGVWISCGMRHLDESLPNGQRERSRAAMRLIKMGVEAMDTWMRCVGHVGKGEKL